MPELRPEQPAREWRLSPAGRAASKALARKLEPYRPTAIVGSLEPKASETAEIVAAELALPFTTAPGLHEHDRSNVPFLAEAAFKQALRNFFEQPEQHTLGLETAREAQARFAGAVNRVLGRHPGGSPVIVAHGTVLSLFAEAKAGVEAFALWQRLELPSYLVFSLPELALLKTVASLTLPSEQSRT